MAEYIVIFTCDKHDPQPEPMISLESNGRRNAIALALEIHPNCDICQGEWSVKFAGLPEELRDLD